MVRFEVTVMPKQKKIVFLDIDGVLLPAADPLAPCYRDACAPDPDTGKKPTAVERTLRLLNTELLKTIKADYQRDPENYKCVLLTHRCLGKSRMERQLLKEQDLPQDLLATQHLISALEQEVGIKPELVTGFSNASVDGVQDTNCDFYKKQFLNYEITGNHESDLDAFEKKQAGWKNEIYHSKNCMIRQYEKDNPDVFSGAVDTRYMDDSEKNIKSAHDSKELKKSGVKPYLYPKYIHATDHKMKLQDLKTIMNYFKKALGNDSQYTEICTHVVNIVNHIDASLSTSSLSGRDDMLDELELFSVISSYEELLLPNLDEKRKNLSIETLTHFKSDLFIFKKDLITQIRSKQRTYLGILREKDKKALLGEAIIGIEKAETFKELEIILDKMLGDQGVCNYHTNLLTIFGVKKGPNPFNNMIKEKLGEVEDRIAVAYPKRQQIRPSSLTAGHNSVGSDTSNEEGSRNRNTPGSGS